MGTEGIASAPHLGKSVAHGLPRAPGTVWVMLACMGAACVAAACGHEPLQAAPPSAPNPPPVAATSVPKPPVSRAEALLTRLEQQIGDAPCSADAECRLVAVGWNPCGGPTRWLAWSTRTAKADALEALAAEQSEAARKLSETLGIQGACVVLPKPTAECRAGRCVAVPPRSGSAGPELAR